MTPNDAPTTLSARIAAHPAARFTVSLPDLAAELGVDAMLLTRQARNEGRILRRLKHPAHAHRVKCLTREDAGALRAYHDEHRAAPEDVAHWLTVDQACRALGITRPAFYQRRQSGSLQGKIEARRLCGPGQIGNQHRYNPADVAREAARIGIRPLSQPRGTVSRAELQAICGIKSKRTPSRWAQRGCPAVQISTDALFFRLPAVLTWMDAQQRGPHVRDHAWKPFETAREKLRAHLAQERAA